MHANASDDSGLQITGRIDTRVHDLADAREQIPEWDQLSRRERYLAMADPVRLDLDRLDDDERELALMEVEPVEENTDYNTTCVSLHEYIVDELDPGQTVDEQASHLAVGNDGSVTPASSDTTLNNEVYRETVTSHADNGNALLCSTFIDSGEANGYTFEEVGIFTDDGTGSNLLLNHSLITAITKDNSKTVTIDVTLEFTAA